MNTTPKLTVTKSGTPGYPYKVTIGKGPGHVGTRGQLAECSDMYWGYPGVTTADILRTIDVLEAREAVLRVYPEARFGNTGSSGEGIYSEPGFFWKLLSREKTEDEAWLDAAVRLPEAKTPVEVAREAVLARWPEARVRPLAPAGHWVEPEPGCPRYQTLGEGKTIDEAWLDAAARLPKEKTPVEVAREAVLARYPEAHVSAGDPWVVFPLSSGKQCFDIGFGKTEDEAWLDAAAKLRKPEEPAKLGTQVWAAEKQVATISAAGEIEITGTEEEIRRGQDTAGPENRATYSLLLEVARLREKLKEPLGTAQTWKNVSDYWHKRNEEAEEEAKAFRVKLEEAERHLGYLATFMKLPGTTWAFVVSETISMIEAKRTEYSRLMKLLEQSEARLQGLEDHIQQEHVASWAKLQALLNHEEKEVDGPLVDLIAGVMQERDRLARWKEEALTVEKWWGEIDAMVRAHPDARLGAFVHKEALRFIRERDELKKVDAAPDRP